MNELILVVDDEPAIVRALTAALRARDHRVAIATTGAEALAEVATRDPAVVILDLGLPDIDGVEVCRQLPRHPGRVITHRLLLTEVWGPEYGDEIQYLRVYANHLRKKLEDDPVSPRLVTEPGVGYRLVDPTGTD